MAKTKQPQYAEGPVTAPFLFVLSHKATEGMWAWFLQKLQDNGINTADCRFVYLLDEPPRGRGGKPLKEQIRRAWHRFANDIRESNPEVVVPLGSETLYYMTGIRRHIFDSRGYLIPPEMYRAAVYDTWDQVGVYKAASKKTGKKKGDSKYKWVKHDLDGGLLGEMNYAGYVIPMFQLDHIRTEGFAVQAAVSADMDRIRRARDGQLRIIDDRFTYVNTLTTELRAHAWGTLVAVDIETHGKNNDVIDCVSISDGNVSATLLWSAEVRDYLSRVFIDGMNKHTIFAFHNSPFDVPRLIEAGVVIPQVVVDRQVFDTMFAAVTIQPDLHKALGRVAPVYMDLFPWKPAKNRDGTAKLWWSSEHTEEYYSAKDAYVTALLGNILVGIMKDLGMWDLFMGQGSHPGPGVMETLPILTTSTREGIVINRAFALTWAARLERHTLRLLKLWTRNFAEYNVGSNKDMTKLFYKEWGFPPQKSQEDGVSVDELACMKLKVYAEHFANDPSTENEGWRSDPRFGPRIFDLLLAIRGAYKNLKTYATPCATSLEARVHPEYLPAAKDEEHGSRSKSKGNTATGRLVAYNPNIQNQPKRARWMYGPDSEEMCFVQADYTRAEPYIMAYSAKDAVMIQDLASGDLYTALQGRLETMGHKVVRKTCKNVFLAGQYLAGANKVSEMLLKQDHVYVEPSECKLVLNGIALTYHDVAAFKQVLVRMCETRGWVRNPFGRVRFFYDGRGPAAVDFWPQSSVADILWCVLKPVAVAARELGGRFTLTVHDSILVQVPERNVPEMVRRMNEIMTRPFNCIAPNFRIPVEFEVGKPGASWGEVKEYKLAEAA